MLGMVEAFVIVQHYDQVSVKTNIIHALRYLSVLSNLFHLFIRYWNNHLRSTLTVSWQDQPARHLKKKLCDYMKPKCHPIFFDSNINSASVVRLNIYQAFLLCAMKFHCYVRDLSYVWKLRPRSYANIIKRSLRYSSVPLSFIFCNYFINNMQFSAYMNMIVKI